MGLTVLVKRKRKTKYMLFAGKGGVGKTSMAAATALRLSRAGKKVLLISTDPAHSLSDSFETPIGGEPVKLSKNLYAVEIDPKLAMKEYKERFMPKLEGIEALKGLGVGDAFDMVGNTPGIDEIAAIDKFLAYMNSHEYDFVVFDTAPTGHTLRFLSLPDVLDSWVGKMIMIRMRFAGLTGMVKRFLPFTEKEGKKPDADAGLDKLNEMKERVKQAKAVLSDPERTSYNMVIIPEEMSILESERSLEALGKYGISVGTVIVNQIIPDNSHCEFCREKRKQQLERIGLIKKKFGRFGIREVEMFDREVKGQKMLLKLGRRLAW